VYYEEKIINGVLCWRSTPNGDWIEKTPKQLTEQLVAERGERKDADECANLAVDRANTAESNLREVEKDRNKWKIAALKAIYGLATEGFGDEDGAKVELDEAILALAINKT
jgi:hypothetical protein